MGREMSGRGNVRSGNCPFREMSVGEVSIGDVSVGELSSGKCQSGNCPHTGQKKLLKVFYKNSCSWKFRNINIKTPKVGGRQAWILFKIRLQCKFFLVNNGKFLWTPTLKNICKRGGTLKLYWKCTIIRKHSWNFSEIIRISSRTNTTIIFYILFIKLF